MSCSTSKQNKEESGKNIHGIENIQTVKNLTFGGKTIQKLWEDWFPDKDRRQSSSFASTLYWFDSWRSHGLDRELGSKFVWNSDNFEKMDPVVWNSDFNASN